MNAKLVSALLVSGACLTLSGCGAKKGVRDLEQFTRQAYTASKPEITPLPEIKPYERYEYSSIDKADPFDRANLVPASDEQTETGEGPDTLRRRQPLEKYPLDGIKMVGTVEKANHLWVVLTAPDKVTYHAKVGDYLGQNYGQIKKISEDKINIEETIRNPAGRWIKREAVLEIAEQPEALGG